MPRLRNDDVNNVAHTSCITSFTSKGIPFPVALFAGTSFQQIVRSRRACKCENWTTMSPSPSDASSISSSSSNGSAGKRPIDPILRNALRYTVSAKEYKLLHDYLISRAPAVEKRTPQPKRFEAIVKNGNDHTIATVRASLRVFVTAYTGFKAWDFILRKLEERRRAGT